MFRFLIVIPFCLSLISVSFSNGFASDQLDFSPLQAYQNSPWIEEFRQQFGSPSFAIGEKIFDELLRTLSCNEIGILLSVGDPAAMPTRLSKALKYAQDMAATNPVRSGSILLQVLQISSAGPGIQGIDLRKSSAGILTSVEPDQFTASGFFLQTERTGAYQLWALLHEPVGGIYFKYHTSHDMSYLRRLLVQTPPLGRNSFGLANAGKVSELVISDILAMPEGPERKALIANIISRFCVSGIDEQHIPMWLQQTARLDFQSYGEMQVHILSSSQECCSKRYEQIVTWNLDTNAWKTLVESYSGTCEACKARSQCLAALGAPGGGKCG